MVFYTQLLTLNQFLNVTLISDTHQQTVHDINGMYIDIYFM
jgi:hypothetical protein